MEPPCPPEDDGPDEAECKAGVTVHNIVGPHVLQVDPLLVQEAVQEWPDTLNNSNTFGPDVPGTVTKKDSLVYPGLFFRTRIRHFTLTESRFYFYLKKALNIYFFY